jgi:hypothetical protein
MKRELELIGMKVSVEDHGATFEITDPQLKEWVSLLIYNEHGLKPGDPEYSERLEERLRKIYRDQVEVMIKFHEDCYKISQNPLYVLNAFLMVRGIGLDIPEWIMGYFVQAALNAELTRIRSLEQTIGEQEKLKIFGFEKKPGKGDVFSRYHKEVERQVAIDYAEN